MTVPIARLVATRFADAPLPLRLCYLASAYRAVLPQRGEMREFVQAGIELIGAPGAEGTAEVIGVLEAALDAAGLDRAVIGLGDADLYRQLLAEFGVEGEARDAVLGRLATHDLVGLEAELAEAGIGDAAIEACVALSQLRGGAEVLERAREIGGDAVERTTDPPAGDLRDAGRARHRRPRADRLRPAARPRLLQRRDLRGLRPGARPRPRRRRPLRRLPRQLRPRPARGRLLPLPGARPRRPDGGGVAAPREGGGSMAGVAGDRRPDPLRRPAEAGGAARRALHRNARPARRGRGRHRRRARRLALADLRDRRDDPGHDAALRRPDLRRGGRRRRRHHRQGRAARAGRPGRLRAARPRLRQVPHGAGRAARRRAPRRKPSGAWG